MSVVAMPVGDHLREWRLRRRMSQLDLACEAEISTRHLSFVETGRSTPSREMILHLAEQLDIPMRERNVLLVAAGYAPLFPERALGAPELKAAREAIELLLESHKPYPAFALDRHWNIVVSNSALPELFEGVDPALFSLHPKGLAPRILNLAEWRAHLLGRLRRQIDLTADPVLIELLDEVQAFDKGLSLARPRPAAPAAEMVIPFRLQITAGVVTFFSTTMVFGTPVEVTLSELALESFFPADAETAAIVRSLTPLPPA
jgi:transcriptional regulator with XRE-family HTH domain